MRISIIGPGAMGCLFAARLAKSGAHVTLVDHHMGRSNQLQQSGITVETDTGAITAKPNVVLRAPAGSDLIIVLTKAYSISGLQFPPDAPVLCLSNGLNNIETLCSAVGSARVLAGVTCEAATLIETGRVKHVAPGPTIVGSWTSCDAKPAIDALRKAGFDTESTDAPGKEIWAKTVINAAINPLSVLLNVPNGKLVEIREVRQLLRDLVVEATKVAATEGYMFEFSMVERTEEVCRQTANNISSMLQDVRRGKPTEIDAISGEILRRAQFAALPTPRTRVVWQLIKGIEQR